MMKTISRSAIAVFCILCFSCVSKKKFNPKNAKKIEQGYLLPVKVDVEEDGVLVVFLQSAQLFNVDNRLKDYERYLHLLNNAKDSCVPVKILVFENTSEIAEVVEATPEVLKNYKRSRDNNLR